MEGITRLVGLAGGECLRCSTCGGMTKIDPLVVIPLNKVVHNCWDDTWLIPPAPVVARR